MKTRDYWRKEARKSNDPVACTAFRKLRRLKEKLKLLNENFSQNRFKQTQEIQTSNTSQNP